MSSASLVPEGLSPHQLISYSTYLRRVQLTALLGIRGEDDDDGNVATSGGLQQQMPSTQAPWMNQPAPAAPPTPPAAPPPPPPPPIPMPQQPVGTAPPTPMQAVPTPPTTQTQPVPTPPPTPVAPAAPAPVPSGPPDGAITGDMLQEGQNAMAAIEQVWGSGQKADILGRLGLTDISHMKVEAYAPFMESLYNFAQASGKSVVQLGPESGNQVLIQ